MRLRITAEPKEIKLNLEVTPQGWEECLNKFFRRIWSANESAQSDYPGMDPKLKEQYQAPRTLTVFEAGENDEDVTYTFNPVTHLIHEVNVSETPCPRRTEKNKHPCVNVKVEMYVSKDCWNEFLKPALCKFASLGSMGCSRGAKLSHDIDPLELSWDGDGAAQISEIKINGKKFDISEGLE